MKTLEDVLFLLRDYDEECDFIALQDIAGEFPLLSDVIDEGLNWADAEGPVTYWLELAEALREYEWDCLMSKRPKGDYDRFGEYAIV